MEVIGMSFKVVSMFSGAGGLDMGFHNKGFKILWANDSAKDTVVHFFPPLVILIFIIFVRKFKSPFSIYSVHNLFSNCN